MPLLLIASDRFDAHVTPPGHPERVERAQVMSAVATAWKQAGGAIAAPRAATRDQLLAVHTAEHCDAIAATAGHAVSLDPDTFTSPLSAEIASLAAGAVCLGVDHALQQRAPAFALVRPPGHHAERHRAMGFCLYNNAAVGAAYALASGLSRVAIVDIDVHHGNGTQQIFYDDPRVLYISTHQFPFYPGTGAATEVGRGNGEGFTVNIPLDAGAKDEDYDLVFREVINPVLGAFVPELLIISAGYDAHDRDPLASMRVTTSGYRRMLDYLWTTGSTVSDGRVVAVSEGGYDMHALGEGLDATVAALSGQPRLPEPLVEAEAPRARPGPPRSEPARRGAAAVRAVRAAQSGYWPTL